MGNITTKRNKSSKGNIFVSGDSNGIDIIDSTVFLENEGNGSDFLSNNGIYRTPPSFNFKEVTYGIQSIALVNDNFHPTYIAPGPLLFTSDSGSPINTTSGSGWVLDNGSYLININFHFELKIGISGPYLINGDQFHIRFFGIDNPSPIDNFITVPFQGFEMPNTIHWFEKFSIITGNLDQIPGTLIHLTIVHTNLAFAKPGYGVIGTTLSAINSTITFTRIND